SWLQMLAHKGNHLAPHIVSVDRVNIKPIEEFLRRLYASFFMATRPPAIFNERRCRRLAKIVGQCGKHYRDLRRIRQTAQQLAGAISNQKRVDIDVAFRMPLRILRDIYQAKDFGEKLIDGTKLAQP